MELLSGQRTPRGIGVSRTVSCRMQAMWGNDFGSSVPREVPNPYPTSVPGLRLRRRQGILIKYFNIDPATAGVIYLIERAVSIGTTQQPSQRGYPIQKVVGSETRRQKRLKQVFLPMTGAIRLFAGALAIEVASTVEYG